MTPPYRATSSERAGDLWESSDPENLVDRWDYGGYPAPDPARTATAVPVVPVVPPPPVAPTPPPPSASEEATSPVPATAMESARTEITSGSGPYRRPEAATELMEPRTVLAMVAAAGLIGFSLAALLFGVIFTGGDSEAVDAGGETAAVDDTPGLQDPAAPLGADGDPLGVRSADAESSVPVPADGVNADGTDTDSLVPESTVPESTVPESTVPASTVPVEETTTTVPATTTTVPETSTTAPVEADVATTVAAPAPAPPSGNDATFQQQVLDLTNAERAAAGCGAVALNPTLNAVADAHSEDMAVNDYFDHTGLNGSQPWDRVAAAGYSARGSGENIAKGYSSAADVVAGWMDSPGHRRNMLDCQWTELGVGYAEGSSTSGNIRPLYWTQVFATPR